MSKHDARDMVLSVPFGGEKTYLRWVEIQREQERRHP